MVHGWQHEPGASSQQHRGHLAHVGAAEQMEPAAVAAAAVAAAAVAAAAVVAAAAAQSEHAAAAAAAVVAAVAAAVVGYCSGYYEAWSASGRASGKKYKAQIVIFCILLAVNRFSWISRKAKIH